MGEDILGSNLAPLGLTGATAPTRFVGGTSAGAPTSGAFAVGDFAVDQIGTIWVCTVAGTPGTWVSATQNELGYAAGTSDVATSSTSLVDVTGLTITVTVGSRPIMVEAYCGAALNSTVNGATTLAIVEGSTVLSFGAVTSATVNAFHPLAPRARLTPTAGSHTYKLQSCAGAFGVGTTGTATLKAGGTCPMFIRAVQL